ncbi:MAG: energy transducer TonB [Blastocatellia bacterium]|nr:energy transducer TonB [Blastocatellia bacterium]
MPLSASLIGIFFLFLTPEAGWVRLADQDTSPPQEPAPSKKLQSKLVQPANVLSAKSVPRWGEGLYRDAIKRVLPEYPRRAKSQKIQGDVAVEFIIDEKGAVKNARALNGPPLLQRSAVKAIKQWKFPPPITEDTPARLTKILTFRFAP